MNAGDHISINYSDSENKPTILFKPVSTIFLIIMYIINGLLNPMVQTTSIQLNKGLATYLSCLMTDRE